MIIRKFYIIILFIFFIFMNGCDVKIQKNMDILSYQKNILSADVIIETSSNEAFSATLNFEDISMSRQITSMAITSPKDLNGICFNLGGNEPSISIHEVLIPLSPSILSGFMPIVNAFTLDKISLVDINSEFENSVTVAHYKNETGEYTVYLNSDAVPIKIRVVSGGRDLIISILKIQYGRE